eukprot:1152346-Pelagomonas_calceolata.AAC.3
MWKLDQEDRIAGGSDGLSRHNPNCKQYCEQLCVRMRLLKKEGFSYAVVGFIEGFGQTVTGIGTPQAKRLCEAFFFPLALAASGPSAAIAFSLDGYSQFGH